MADARKLKEKATEAFQKGKFVKAAEAYAEYCEADPKDLQARLRMGDAWSKGGKKDKAIASYTWAAEGFAKDGFLPRAIAASKLILELDPSHKGVQKMLADLYARKTTAPAAGGGARPMSMKIETKVDVQTTAAGFAHRKDAIELEAPPGPAAKHAAPASWKPNEAPSPMNRKDAIELPEYEVPGAETITESASVPMAKRGPSPTRREDAIEIEEETTRRDGPEALSNTQIDLDVSVTGAQPIDSPGSGISGEIEVPIEGVELPAVSPPLTESFELKVEAPLPAPESFELHVEPLPPAPPPPAKVWDLSEEAVEELELVEVADSPPPYVPPKPPMEIIPPVRVAAKPALEVVSAPTVIVDLSDAPKPRLEVMPEPAAGPTLEVISEPASEQPGSFARSVASEGEKSGSFTAPPGMKPRRAATEVPAEPQAPRIWLPGNFAPPAVTALEPIPQAPASVAAAAPSPESLTDLERGLQLFSNFDADDFKPAKAAVPSPRPAISAPSARRTFTELELEGDSLLHAVEAAAAVGVEQRGEVAGHHHEEAMDMPDDHKLEPGELPKIPLFSDLPPDAFIALFERCPLKRAEPGNIVIQQGSLGDSFYVICGGSVRVFRMDGEQRREIATLEEGAFFGEMALLSGAARTASVEAASEDTQLLEISAPILTELSHRYPQVATALKKFCRQRLLSNLMGSATLFQPFSRNDRRELVQKFRARDVAKGDILIKEGHRSDGMYVILSGEVEVRVGPTQVASLKEGDVFGEMSLLTKTNATATVAASKHTSLLRLPREDFDLIIMSHPQVLVLVSELTDSRAKQNATIASHRPPTGDAAPMV